jgi:hypothetical protein
MKSKKKRAKEVLRKEGFRNLLGKSLRHFANSIISRERQKRRIISNYSERRKFLNVGGGDFLKDNWRVLDFHSESYGWNPAFVDYNTNLESESKWPIRNESYDLVYSSHTLEHLSEGAVDFTLEEIFRILKPGCGVRINVPDTGLAISAYESGDLSWFRDVWMGYEDDFGDCKHPDGNYDDEFWLEFYLISFFASYLVRSRDYDIDLEKVRSDYERLETADFFNKYSNKVSDSMQSKNPGWHRNWFTMGKLRDKLESKGFTQIERSRCRKSRHNEMNTEEFDRRPHMSVYIDAMKPE